MLACVKLSGWEPSLKITVYVVPFTFPSTPVIEKGIVIGAQPSTSAEALIFGVAGPEPTKML